MSFQDRTEFLNLAGAFQAGLVVVSMGLAWLFQVNPWDYFAWDGQAWLASFLATLPMCGLAVVCFCSSWSVLRELRDLWVVSLGPALEQCRWWDLLLLSLLVGITEELLFRGIVQMALARWSLVGALIITNTLFGLLHAVTLSYFVLATLLGWYMSFVMLVVEPPNLLIPMAAHAGYDFCSFLLLRKHSQHTTGENSVHAPKDP